MYCFAFANKVPNVASSLILTFFQSVCGQSKSVIGSAFYACFYLFSYLKNLNFERTKLEKKIQSAVLFFQFKSILNNCAWQPLLKVRIRFVVICGSSLH
jgi:hypothetical protein